MDKLEQKILQLEKIYKNEQKKKYKKEKKQYIPIDYDIKKFMKEKEENNKKNSIRLKSLRGKEEKKPIENFNKLYKEQEQNKFKTQWKKLNKVLQKNRIYEYLNRKKNELNWSIEKYNKNIILYLENYEINRLNPNINYNDKIGKIYFCNL